jgi:hypothetical protein
MAPTDRTGWLGGEDSNSEMSWQNIALKGRTDFQGIQPNFGDRDYSRLSCGVSFNAQKFWEYFFGAM